ncbi:M24 family metallopeptidase [Colwelliaceae bacterium BS250]
MRFNSLLLVLLALVNINNASANAYEKQQKSILSMQQRAIFVDEILTKRVKLLMPKLMTEANIDMWILISREYNEDPVLKTLLPATWMGARRRTILVFTNTENDGVKAQAMSRYDVGNTFTKAWNKDIQPDQWQALTELITLHDPKNIALNQSADFALADGLVASESELLLTHLPKKYQQRVVSAEKLAVSWLETRIDDEIATYQQMVALTKSIINQGFSSTTITPGKTTVGELVWWFRDTVNQLGLDTWFQPSIRVQRSAESILISENPELTILAGDLLHVDFGIKYLRLNTDIQQHAYVLKDNETQAPKFLQQALTTGNKLQSILTKNFVLGRSGNDILAKSLEQAKAAGIKPMIYSHPIGYYGHSAGTTIGMWDSQNGVPGGGDYQLNNNTAYAIELNVNVYSDEWKKDITIMLEENAYFHDGIVSYLAPRQEQLILIK